MIWWPLNRNVQKILIGKYPVQEAGILFQVVLFGKLSLLGVSKGVGGNTYWMFNINTQVQKQVSLELCCSVW